MKNTLKNNYYHIPNTLIHTAKTQSSQASPINPKFNHGEPQFISFSSKKTFSMNNLKEFRKKKIES
jgi:hypothetical protein